MSISGACRLVGIHRQDYYRQVWSIARQRSRATEVISLVQSVRAEMPRIGTRKLYHLLNDELRAMGVGRDKLFDILRANGELITPIRSYHVTTNSHHRFRKHKNLIVDVVPSRPEQIVASDITYIGGRDNHMYLSLVTDVYSKKIMGYDLSDSLDTDGALNALRMAHRNRIYNDRSLIHHSDRGIQYCSDAYQKALHRYKMTPSMTESYDPYANAVAERVNGILKQEFLLESINLPLKVMKNVIRDAIYIYNNRRPHFSCGYLTPQEMHLQQERNMKTYKAKKSLQGHALAEIDK